MGAINPFRMCLDFPAVAVIGYLLCVGITIGLSLPPEAIVGAWEVDQNGKLTGTFVENPNDRRRT
ncbi:hypothetical protein ACLB90_08735 [Stenotrophomonas sp. LGBM10]|uniref:hypothetical protein n=1 Tax=Stenotrophomonas sp. LGBM10 TaxID=3390038 RepID=UPI00398AF1B8